MINPSSTNGDDPFQVVFSGLIAQTIRQLQRQATLEGRGREFLDALREAVKRLHTDPSSFGEPLYRLPGLRMRVRSGLIRPLAVHFGVCEDRPLVFITGVKLLAAKGS